MSKHVLAQNQYGKAENRIVRIARKGGEDGAWHEIRDLN
ncbi:urate oxidase, partial [Streptomyces roseolus]